MASPVGLVSGKDIARYGFPNGHPLGGDRHDVFLRELQQERLESQLIHLTPRSSTRAELESFHTAGYIDFVIERSIAGEGLLDAGDTPAFPGVFEAAGSVVGATLVAVEAIMTGRCRRAFVPIAGLHHAARSHAAGFCVFNDCGIAIEILRKDYGLHHVGYVDIDAHHGDGVFYGFESDPEVSIADIHEDGRYLYPGTGAAGETGKGAAAGTKLNLPLMPGATDIEFRGAWEKVEAYLTERKPDFILLQCGADSLAGDPLTHLRFSEGAHAHAAARLCELADRFGHGRVLGLGGGGYNRRNLARAWTRVVQSFLGSN